MTTSPETTTSAPPAAAAVAVRAERLSKSYGAGDAAVRPLRELSLEIPRARFTAIMGPSGSGKSTLMHVLAGLDGPDAGRVVVGDVELTGLDEKRLTEQRRAHIGFIFQAYNLVPAMTAEENILLPAKLGRTRVDRQTFDAVVDRLGLRDRLGHRPFELSGGQQQRVAVARALVTRPAVIFADEPTGNLDHTTGAEVLQLLRTAVDELDQTVIMVTHDPGAAAVADRTVLLDDGRVVDALEGQSAETLAAALVEVGR
ncbi:ABC transporter ATP-binding protein [Nesterenkonia halobia]|uniref:ABC transporter ATP-binding protein n=1 Tax=Nesterenkonia halobia TaxID=37922 RepID=A0ABP6RBG1_9MICC